MKHAPPTFGYAALDLRDVVPDASAGRTTGRAMLGAVTTRTIAILALIIAVIVLLIILL